MSSLQLLEFKLYNFLITNKCNENGIVVSWLIILKVFQKLTCKYRQDSKNKTSEFVFATFWAIGFLKYLFFHFFIYKYIIKLVHNFSSIFYLFLCLYLNARVRKLLDTECAVTYPSERKLKKSRQTRSAIAQIFKFLSTVFYSMVLLKIP